jgi:Yip1 domain
MNLVQRAQRILLQPQQEWPVIESEPTGPAQLYPGYIIPLAAIGPIALIIGLSVIGISYGFGSVRIPIQYSILWAIVYFALSLAMVYVLALLADALAPSFSGQKNFNQAFKLATYIHTPLWIASVILILPTLDFLAFLAGLYGIFLLFLGAPILMKTPQDKTIGYVAILAIASGVLAYLAWRIAGEIVFRVIISPF